MNLLFVIFGVLVVLLGIAVFVFYRAVRVSDAIEIRVAASDTVFGFPLRVARLVVSSGHR